MSKKENVDVTVTVTVTVYHETDKALLIDEVNKIWLPHSQIDVLKQQGDKYTISLPKWLAEKLDLL